MTLKSHIYVTYYILSTGRKGSDPLPAFLPPYCSILIATKLDDLKEDKSFQTSWG